MIVILAFNVIAPYQALAAESDGEEKVEVEGTQSSDSKEPLDDKATSTEDSDESVSEDTVSTPEESDASIDEDANSGEESEKTDDSTSAEVDEVDSESGNSETDELNQEDDKAAEPESEKSADEEEQSDSIQPKEDSTTEETNENEETVSDSGVQKAEVQSIRMTALEVPEESATSKLGHLHGDAVIYTDLTDLSSSIPAAGTYTNQVYYIKKQAKLSGDTYYLISNKPSSTEGTVGWVKAGDIQTYSHKTLDHQSKSFYLKGTGSAFSKAWGGSKDLVFGDLTGYKNEEFKVNLTETVGENVWYRGTLDGNTVWLHSAYVTTAQEAEESAISRLGHLRGDAVIYNDLNDLSSSVAASGTYTNAVYYIKKQALLNGQKYYLISQKPSSVNGIIGWVEAEDMVTYSHETADHDKKTFYIKGTGSAYNKAWGGPKDLVYEKLSNYKNQEFQVNLTETVGDNIWYRGVLNGETVWIHSNYVTNVKESSTSRLGHLRGDAVILDDLEDLSSSTPASPTYTNAVYYIKKQAEVSEQKYYLISTKPSSVNGVVGWVNAEDIVTNSHKTVDQDTKTFYIKGTGSAYSKAWGGSKNLVFKDLSGYKNEDFKVDLTEKVGNNIWYRGTLDGEKIWLHSSYVTNVKESSISRLGHLRGDAVIYPELDQLSSSIPAADTFTNAVYYIKKQAQMSGSTYYLISTKPSSVNGTIGWVESDNMVTYSHTTVDHKAKTFYVKGTGSAYSKVWGGSKDLVYQNLSTYKDKAFAVNLTEKVGNNVWYRGTLNGKTVWIHEAYLKKSNVINTSYSDYDLTLNKMLDIQMAVAPQTDKRYKLWIREDGLTNIANGQATVKGDNWRLRRGPGTSYSIGGTVNNGKVLPLYSSTKGSDGYKWYHVSYTSGWVIPDREDVLYYLDYRNFTGNLKDSLQFLNLSQSANIDVNEVNQKVLTNKGSLSGKAQAFVTAGRTHGVNEIYLIAHALLETGNGSSTLASGVKYNNKTVYNMYGIGARDACPIECGAKKAYELGWFTPEQAIIGGAAFIGDGYVNAGQNTLYKMRWNPAFAANYNYASHQYATDIGWAYKQTSRMYELYNLLDGYTLNLDLPRYK